MSETMEHVTPRYSWEFDVLGVYNYRKPGPLSVLFDFVRDNAHKIEGDVVDAGVFRGRSLVGMALMLRELGVDKKVYGFDSFAGFPEIYHPNDEIERFADLRAAGSIAPLHYELVQRNVRHRTLGVPSRMGPENLSLSGNFSGTSMEIVRRKLDYFGLTNVVLVDGPFSETFTPQRGVPGKVMAANLDCDLYESYVSSLGYLWGRMAVGGMIYLDEYYSLKFPGARIATDEFARRVGVSPQKDPETARGEFERWFLIKT
jgi:hypothetical protein